MKNFLGFIALLASNGLFACGFYPYGEELRFSFFNPDLMGYHSYSEFYYSANTFGPQEVYRDFDQTPNELSHAPSGSITKLSPLLVLATTHSAALEYDLP